MKEEIYTIPINDAFHANDECPFCFIERKLERDSIAFILGSAYMEEDVREETDKVGFCRHHYKKMFDYGNHLGNALILKTHLIKMNSELKEQLKQLSPTKNNFLKKIKKTNPIDSSRNTPIGQWTTHLDQQCYVCNHFADAYQRYLRTFFEMLKKDEAFFNTVAKSKGFCLHHFGDLMEYAGEHLSTGQQESFYPMISEIMQTNLERLIEDISWFVDKYDYRNKDADWKNSKDAVTRSMQKLAGGYPSDPVFMADR